MRAITILFVLLMASVVQAQALAVRTIERQCTANGCQEITGTGACSYIGNIDNRSVYLTAAHVINNVTSFHIGYGGQWLPGKVVYKQYTDKLDYAIVETQAITATKCFPVASYQPTDGVVATAYGYSQGIYNLRSLKAKIRVNRNGRYFSKMVAKGDSGGPILANGQVVGVISAIVPTRGTTIFTNSVLIRSQIIRIYGRMPACGGSVIVASPPQKPDPPVPKPDLTEINTKIALLQEKLDRLTKTQIPVQIIGSNDQVLSEQTYPLGSPIKLRFKAVKQSEAK
ncbi:serine protease [uncultured Gimesia sp.]|uniref:S1 family peptidase n=1 Tax=uncultured Gimesia sp. TaxID=1678688 RepID=UPI002638DFB6|nr:serine protease [uncultured Gimesia sp.]